MVMHEASSYSTAPQMALFATKGRGSMLAPGAQQSISIANNLLFVCTITINFHVHSWGRMESKKYSNGRHDRKGDTPRAASRGI
jgi:hypothetical protein